MVARFTKGKPVVQVEMGEAWTPSRAEMLRWTVYGIALFGVGLMVFATVWGGRWGEVVVTLAGWDLLIGLAVTVVLSFGLLAFHEWLHGLAMRRYGATPRYGATMVAKMMPAFFCTSPGTLFTRRQFMVIALTPFLVISVLCMVLLVLGRWSGWLIVPAAFHLSGCVGDFTVAAKVARLEAGTRLEDQISGLRIYRSGPVATPDRPHMRRGG
jgi:hypothetical protein